jgi:hypothetical protein
MFLHDKNKILSYSIASLSLLFYESGFLVFLFMPIFRKDFNFNAKWQRQVLQHLSILLGIILLYLFIRRMFGEGRFNEMVSGNFRELTRHIIYGLSIGVFTSGKLFLYRVITTIKEVNIFSYIAIVAFFCGALIIVKFKLLANIIATTKYPSSSSDGLFYVIIAFCALGMSYLFAFTHYPPNAMSGRGTSVHLAASVGWAFFIAIVYEQRNLLPQKFLKFINLSILFVLSCLFGFHIIVQQSFVDMHTFQKKIYKDVLTLLENNLKQGDIIVLNILTDKLSNDSKFSKRFIEPFSWETTLILPQFYRNIQEWRMIALDQPEDIKVDNGEILLNNPGYPEWGRYVKTPIEHLLVFDIFPDGAMLAKSIQIGNEQFNLRQNFSSSETTNRLIPNFEFWRYYFK